MSKRERNSPKSIPAVKSEPKEEKKAVYIAQETFFFKCDGVEKTIRFNSEFTDSDFPNEELKNKILLNVKHKIKE